MKDLKALEMTGVPVIRFMGSVESTLGVVIIIVDKSVTVIMEVVSRVRMDPGCTPCSGFDRFGIHQFLENCRVQTSERGVEFVNETHNLDGQDGQHWTNTIYTEISETS